MGCPCRETPARDVEDRLAGLEDGHRSLVLIVACMAVALAWAVQRKE